MPVSIHQADVIAASGGNARRTHYGVDLYHQGLAPELWHTGYAHRELSITATVISGGVPPYAFRWLSTTNTFSDGQQIARALRSQGIGSILVVTDWWHSRRMLCALRQQIGGSNVEVYFAAPPAPAGPDNWWRDSETRNDVIHEIIGLAYYAARYGIAPWGCEPDYN